jgi:hypothetical protein
MRRISLIPGRTLREYLSLKVHLPTIKQGWKESPFTGVYGSGAEWHNYYRYIGYFQKDEFDG